MFTFLKINFKKCILKLHYLTCYTIEKKCNFDKKNIRSKKLKLNFKT